MSNDIDIIKVTKFDFIEVLIGRGVQYETCAKISAAINGVVESLATPSPANGVAGDLPEPVAYLRFRSAQSWSGSGNNDIEYNEWLETCYAHEIGDDKLPAMAAYSAEQLRAAVLAERERVAAICDALKEQRFSSGNIREGSAARTLAEMIRART